VPRIIWSFWNDHSSLPRVVRLALASWAAFAPAYDARLLGAHNWQGALGTEAAGANSTNAAGGNNLFADWLRFQLLASHGGVWMDATVVLTAPLDLLVNETAELSGVHLDGALFESYFLAAVPGSKIITGWRDEFSRIALMSEQEYDLYLAGLKARGVEPLNGQFAVCHWADKDQVRALLHQALHAAAWLGNLFIGYTGRYVHPCGQRFWMHYLNSFVAFNAVVETDGGDPRPLWDRFGVSAQNTRETLSLAAHLNKWEDDETARFLATRGSAEVDLRRIRGVKLRNKERRALEAWSHCEEGSIICRVQGLVNLSVFEERPWAAEAVEL